MARVFIYGSCVSRDTLELSKNHEIVAYIARQSLISAASPPTKLLSTEALESKFQNRSLNGDLESNLFPTLTRKSSDLDLFVMDITDERFGTFALPDGAYITHSVELQRSGALGLLEKTPPRLNLGTDRHYKLWTRAANQLKERLSAEGNFEKAIVLKTPWALKTITGSPVEPFRRIPTTEMNQRYQIYYDHLSSMGFKIAELPEELALSSDEHKWGPAPFHFSDRAYDFLLNSINKIIA